MSQSIIEKSMAARETRMEIRAGETLFREGELPRGVYILRSGIVRLLFNAKCGTPKPLREAQPGQILGLSSVVMKRAHDCTATAAEPCDVAFIDKDDLIHALDDSPATWVSVLQVLSSEVSAVYDDIRVLAAR